MKISERFSVFRALSLALVLVLCGAGLSAGEKTALPTVAPLQTLFRAGEGGATCYRIPAMIRARNGDLIVLADARRKGWGDLHAGSPIDIVVRRSSDNGESWTPPAVLSDLPDGISASDASLILDRETGSLFCFYNGWDKENRPGVYLYYVQESKDNGRSWGKPRELTKDLRRPEWPEKPWAFITSGHGCQLADGTLLHTMTRVDTKEACLFGSSDHGKSWGPIGKSATPGDENKVVELPDGSWMVNTRVNGARCRWSHLSRDRGKSWESREEKDLADPGCNGALLQDGERLYLSNINCARDRRNLTLRESRDGGRSWSEGIVIEAGPAGYSDIALLPDGRIAVFFESEACRAMAFTTIRP